MTDKPECRPERYQLGPNLDISRVLTGLWQVADIERSGERIDLNRGADALQTYSDAGFTTFDTADHYGSSELIAGRLLSRFRAGTGRPAAQDAAPPAGGGLRVARAHGGARARRGPALRPALEAAHGHGRRGAAAGRLRERRGLRPGRGGEACPGQGKVAVGRRAGCAVAGGGGRP